MTSVGIEPTTSGLDLPLLSRLSYEVGQRKSGTMYLQKIIRTFNFPLILIFNFLHHLSYKFQTKLLETLLKHNISNVVGKLMAESRYPLRSSTVVNSASAFFTAGAVIVPSSGSHCKKQNTNGFKYYYMCTITEKKKNFDLVDLVHFNWNNF